MNKYNNKYNNISNVCYNEAFFPYEVLDNIPCPKNEGFWNYAPDIKIGSEATEISTTKASERPSIDCESDELFGSEISSLQDLLDLQDFEFESEVMMPSAWSNTATHLSETPDESKESVEPVCHSNDISFMEPLSPSPLNENMQPFPLFATFSKSRVSLYNSFSLVAMDSQWTNIFSSLGRDYKPSDWDVICGRGKHSYTHIGNRRFRNIVANKLRQYIEANTKQERSEVVNSIFLQILEAGGIFVKQDEEGIWCNIGTRLSQEKIAHTFRDSLPGLLRRSVDLSTEENQAKLTEARDSILRSCQIRITIDESDNTDDSITSDETDDVREAAKDKKESWRESKRAFLTNKSTGSRSHRIYVEEVAELDILCGRGGKSNQHYGNKKYRNVISDMKTQYKSTEGKLAKTDLSATIVDHVYAYGGRFLKKDVKEGKYYLLTPKEARKKTSQALRENKKVKWVI